MHKSPQSEFIAVYGRRRVGKTFLIQQVIGDNHVCGSATSWIINNLIKNRGGLHNRVTHKIPLKPFTLRECELYFKARGFRYSRKQIAECYMMMGGVNTNVFSWFGKGDNRKAQIDLLIDRADKSVVVTIRTPHMVSPQQAHPLLFFKKNLCARRLS